MPFVERQHPRFPLQLPVSFSGNQEGTGIVKNLSLGGCQVESQTEAYAGDYLSLKMQLTEGDSPLTVDAAAVRWSEGYTFGLSFDWLKPQEQDRLNRFLSTLQVS
ncbi:MAG: PilZ domain-containing protein [Nitrospiraceae bacterium]